jgi:hypothetical protein
MVELIGFALLLCLAFVGGVQARRLWGDQALALYIVGIAIGCFIAFFAVTY